MMSIAGSQQAAPNITLAAPDDNMELGSDAGRNEENDIDFDFPINQDDDFMMDARSENGQDAHNIDHQMDDDNFDGGIVLATEDEHLADASDIGLENSVFSQTAMPLSENDLIDYDDGDDDDAPEEDALRNLQEPGQSLERIAMSTSLEPKLSDIQQIPTPRADSPARYPSHQSHSMTRQGSQHDQTSHNVSSAQDDSETRSTHDFVAAESTNLGAQPAFEDEEHTNFQPEPALDQKDFTNYSIDEGTDVHPLLPEASELETADVPRTRSSLHPVTVNWNNEEYHLFRLQEDDDPDIYFTADESLAKAPLRSLFAACRDTLRDEINSDDELEMDMQGIGLFINEDSVHCSNYTFNNILETYVLLHEQDGSSDPNPLYVTLTTNSRFSSRLESLREAASEGKGLSSLTFLQALNHETGNEEEFYEDAQYSPEDDEGGDQEAQYHGESNDNVHFTDNHAEDNVQETYPVAHDDYDQAKQYTGSAPVDHADNDQNFEAYDQSHDENHEPVGLDETDQAAEDHVENSAPLEHAVDNPQSTNGEEASTERQTASEAGNELIDYLDEEAEVEPNEELSGDRSTGSSTVQGDEHGPSHVVTGEDSVVPEAFNENVHTKFNSDTNTDDFNVHGSTLVADEYNESASADYSGVNNPEQYGDSEFVSLVQEQFEAAEWEQENAEYGDESLGQDYVHEDTAAYDQEAHTYEEPGHDDGSYIDTSLYDQENVESLGNEEEGVGDYGDEEHGNFDYPEFNDQPTEGLAETNEIEREHGEPEHGFDVIDYGNENEEEDGSHHSINEPLVGSTHSSPPQKRTFDELVGDEANSSNDPQDIKRVRPS